MKRTRHIILILLVFVLILSLIGCKKKNTDIEETKRETPDLIREESKDEKARDRLMAEFAELMDNKSLDLLVEFADSNIGNFSSIEADEILLGLQEILEENIARGAIFKDYRGELMEIAGGEMFFPRDRIGDIGDQKLRADIERAFKNKYKLINMEGQFYPVVDYEELRAYDDYVSSQVRDYIDIRASMSNEPMAVDAALIISYDKLADRILQLEDYLKDYPQGKKYEEILGFYEDWLWVYLNGLPNTPIEDQDTKIVYKDVYESYKRIGNTKDSATGLIVSKYIDRIGENKGLIDESILEKNTDLIDEALFLLKASK
ncbi:MAG: hypothetical protein WC983_03005 [Tissierellaceae bacterium]